MNNKQRSTQTSLKNNLLIKNNGTCELYDFIIDKNSYLQRIIRNTIISIRINNQNEIFSDNDSLLATSLLTETYQKTIEINKKLKNSTTQKDYDNVIELLQTIIDKLSMVICGFGTINIEDLLFICFGSEFKDLIIEDPLFKDKYELIKKHIRPIGYKIIKWKQSRKISNNNDKTLCSNKITDETINLDDAKLLECFETDILNKNLSKSIYELRIVIPNDNLKKTLIIYGIIDDIQIELFESIYVQKRIQDIMNNSIRFNEQEKDVIKKIVNIMTLKDVLIFSDEDIYKKMISVFTEVNNIKKKNIETTIKYFIELDAFSQRDMIINLILYNKDDEIRYICFLLYELITINSLENNYQNEQKQIYDTLPHNIKKYFKDIIKYSMEITVENTQKYEKKNISFEQQIHLMKASDNIKEKAIIKLKEIKGKTDENGLKAKQYLEGLIKIPFGIYREEPILIKLKEINNIYNKSTSSLLTLFKTIELNIKDVYTSNEITKNINKIESFITNNIVNIIKSKLESKTTKEISELIKHINIIVKNDKSNKKIIIGTNKKNKQLQISLIIDNLKESDISIKIFIYDKIMINENNHNILQKIINDFSIIKTIINSLEPEINNMYNILDKSIYGHDYAKKQIMKVISQWMSGEQKGYCFGFEGSPGIGKTSLAKNGLANCLKNNDNDSRPFSFIALGGSCHGSFLEGHGYTYINSSWGKITDILMQSKCMNPIIYIDELDKVSNTENGKEIIGILTHLIDQTQNDSFQDKYFNGIDIDLSKVLFVFSYNDPEKIDKVLMDRIHRIKFENLSIKDKIVIVNKFILPEINKKMGFEKVIEISNEIIEYIIETYTAEPGVRKLKELLFDLFGEINLEILKNSTNEKFIIPILITEDNLYNKYLKKYIKIQEKKISTTPNIGVVNGLWANSLGIGGVIPIQSQFFPCSTFLDLRLTGLQGDIMKESMNVAKTIAWNLTPSYIKVDLLKEFEKTKSQGLHIHCPEGAISKDGPSAGTAITISIYSLFNNKKVKQDVAITGEITLQGNVTSIGGLDAKINGGIIAGIKKFLYPKTNNKDFLEWKDKNCKNIDDITFIEISTIEDVFDHIFM